MIAFRWNEWNISHIGEHGVRPAEAERVIRAARPPFPERRGDEKWRVVGQTDVGRFLHVIYVVDPAGTLFVIHARELTDIEKRRYRRRRR